MLKQVALPRTKNVWAPPGPRSARRAIAKRLARSPHELVYYPDLPPFRTKVWCLWRDGHYGVCEYKGGWTYRSDDGTYVNEMPICWCVVRSNDVIQPPRSGRLK